MSDTSANAAAVVTCANHACAKSLDLEIKKDANVLCPLCASPSTVYCSEACRMTDWISHKCDNAFLVSAAMGQKDVTVFVPYHFEDTLDAKEHKQWLDALTPAARIEGENQHALVQVLHPDQTVSQHLMPLGERATFRPMDPKFETVFRRGREPRERVKEAEFVITLTFPGATPPIPPIVMTGNVDERAIYKDHAPAGTQMGGKIIQYLLNRRKETADTVLFVKPEESDYVQVPRSGTMKITVDINKRRVTTMEGPYKMRGLGFEFTRAIGKFLVPRLKALFPDAATDNIKDYKTLRGTLGHTEFILVFEVPRKKKLRGSEEKDMYFRGLVYQVSADKLEHDAQLLPLKVPAAAAAPEPSAPQPQVSMDSGESSPPPPRRDDVKLWNEEAGVAPPPPPSWEDEAALPPPPPPPPPSRSTSVSLVPAPEAPPPPPPGWSAGTLPTTPTETSPVSSPDTQRKSYSLNPDVAAGVVRRRSSISDDDDEEDIEAAITPQSAIFPLRCDASDVSQLVGLAMALELRERDLPAHASVPASVVRNHARALMEKRIEDPSAVPMEVSAAVYSVIQTLHELPVNQ